MENDALVQEFHLKLQELATQEAKQRMLEAFQKTGNQPQKEALKQAREILLDAIIKKPIEEEPITEVEYVQMVEPTRTL